MRLTFRSRSGGAQPQNKSESLEGRSRFGAITRHSRETIAIEKTPVDPLALHSRLSATSGSTFAARRAGI